MVLLFFKKLFTKPFCFSTCVVAQGHHPQGYGVPLDLLVA